MSLKDKILARGWTDDGTDTEWDEETKKDWEEKMGQYPFPPPKEDKDIKKSNNLSSY